MSKYLFSVVEVWFYGRACILTILEGGNKLCPAYPVV
jgi:hypothetical protein